MKGEVNASDTCHDGHCHGQTLPGLLYQVVPRCQTLLPMVPYQTNILDFRVFFSNNNKELLTWTVLVNKKLMTGQGPVNNLFLKVNEFSLKLLSK